MRTGISVGNVMYSEPRPFREYTGAVDKCPQEATKVH